MTDKSARETDHTLVETVARALAKSAGHVPHRIDMMWRYYADMAKDAIMVYLAALEAGGFAVVPKVPTEAMHGALIVCNMVRGDVLNYLTGKPEAVRDIWRHMLAASNPKGEGK